MASDKTTPQLDLSTARFRQHVRVDGVDYDMRDWDEMDLDTIFQARKMFETLKDLDSPAPDENLILDTMRRIDSFVRYFLPGLPSETFDKLTAMQKLGVVNVAQVGSNGFFQQPEAAPKLSKSRRNSKGSTAAVRATGKQ